MSELIALNEKEFQRLCVRKENSYEASRDRSYRSRTFRPHLGGRPSESCYGQSKNQITIYDAFGTDPSMTKDWRFSALVEFAGKRILFDTEMTPTSLQPM